MRVVRPAGPDDFDALMELAVLSGPGFTTLPADEEPLRERLELSRACFSGEVAPGGAWYTLMLENMETGTIDGVSAVRGSIGLERPHFSFRVVTLAQFSSAIDTRFDHQVLVLANECSGWTEVGSLFLRAEARSGGTGSLLARSRYLLIAADPVRFSPTVMAELRGYIDGEGNCAFWDGVASKFFRLPFDRADRMIMSTDGQFILDLAPRHPIYVDLLADDAREAIGKVHPEGETALAMLQKEGFDRSGLIDIFDGGPTMTCQRDRIDTVARARRIPARIAADVATGKQGLIATTRVEKFRAKRADMAVTDDQVTITPDTADALQVAPGDIVQIRV